MDATTCFKCRRDLNKGRDKHVAVSFKGETRLFHPDCHVCSGPCGGVLRKKYTVVPATGLPLCEKCWQAEHGSDGALPAVSGGVSWTVKAPAERGFVWSQVVVLDHATPGAAEKAKQEAREKPLGRCDACSKAVYDSIVRAGKNSYHVACHLCRTCRKELASASFLTLGAHNYCEDCAAASLVSKVSISPRSAAAPQPQAAAKPVAASALGACGKCSRPIAGKAVVADGKSYCVGCLTCLDCRAAVGPADAFFPRPERGGVICEKCGE